ncbi:MAG: hypothetical protein WC979_03390 [Candidatus Pacearchaeota archaeon]|jgi:hypothetical protein
MKYLLLSIAIAILTSCSDYDGPLYRVVVQHTGKDNEQRDTLILGIPKLSDYQLTADVPGQAMPMVIYNVRSFKILNQIRDRYVDSALAVNYKRNCYFYEHK